MKLTVLIENTAPPHLIAEWGLSLHIEFRGRNYLLDSGASGNFAENAQRLGIDLAKVDAAVLSHAHNDHSDGMDVFCEINRDAPVYIREGVSENCYGLQDREWVYEGIRKGLLDSLQQRIRTVRGREKLAQGVYLIPHSMPGLASAGLKAHMFVEAGGIMRPDDLSHEQSLVFDTSDGLVIFNSCSHAGADGIVREATAAFPGRPMLAMIGGFHLFDSPAAEVRALAERLKDTGVRRVITGHCTGEEAFKILKEVMGEAVEAMETGAVFTL